MDFVEVQEVVRFCVERVISSKRLSEDFLILKRQYSIPNGVQVRVVLARAKYPLTVIEVVDRVSLVGEAINTHRDREPNHLRLIESKLRLKCAVMLFSPLLRLFIYRDSVQVLALDVVHVDRSL